MHCFISRLYRVATGSKGLAMEQWLERQTPNVVGVHFNEMEGSNPDIGRKHLPFLDKYRYELRHGHKKGQ